MRVLWPKFQNRDHYRSGTLHQLCPKNSSCNILQLAFQETWKMPFPLVRAMCTGFLAQLLPGQYDHYCSDIIDSLRPIKLNQAQTNEM